MGSPTGRRLQVLAILQAHPGTTAERLAARLGVTERTARRDVADLRDVGYRIDARPGRHGGYALAAGAVVPPLLLDDDEAVAVAVGLRVSTGVAGLGPAAVTALAKLSATVPNRVRARVEALAAAAAPTGEAPRTADPGVLTTLALACRAAEAVRFRHRRAGAGAGRARDAQPHRLVTLSGRWYLIACERDRGEWATYAVDRISDAHLLGTRLGSPEPPRDAVSFVVHALVQGARRHRVQVRVHTSGDLVRQLVDPAVAHVVDDGPDCLLELGTDDLDWAARWLAYLDLDLDVLHPPELTDRLHALGQWITQRYSTDPPT